MENQKGKDTLLDLGRNGCKMGKKRWGFDIGGGELKIGKIGLLLFGRLWS